MHDRTLKRNRPEVSEAVGTRHVNELPGLILCPEEVVEALAGRWSRLRGELWLWQQLSVWYDELR